MDFNQFAFWLLTGLLGTVLLVTKQAISRLTDAIEALNRTVAVEIEKTRWMGISLEKHERLLEKHEERLNKG